MYSNNYAKEKECEEAMIRTIHFKVKSLLELKSLFY